MLNKLLDYLKNKELLILGFGMEGQATYRFIRRHFTTKMLHIADSSPEVKARNEYLGEDINTELHLGKAESLAYVLEFFAKYPNGILIKSPGVYLKELDVSAFEKNITSQTDLFLRFINLKTIGITGTKGKSTTSSLIYKILVDQDFPVRILGNIGLPIFDSLEGLTPNTICVLELSSHQLEYVQTSPNIALMTNIFPEHLDHYATIVQYIDAKFNIARYQNKNDSFIYPCDNKLINEYFSAGFNPHSSAYILFESKEELNNMRETLKGRKLLGEHNLKNILFAITAASLVGADVTKALETAKSFEGLPHRMAHFEAHGKHFYDDAIATIPEAVIECVKTLFDKHGAIDSLIIGGLDRGIEQDELTLFLTQGLVKNIICMPDTGHQIGNNLVKLGVQNVFLVKNLEEAVFFANARTPKGGTCVLSPAAASYGQFKNFQEKGDRFKDLAKKANNNDSPNTTTAAFTIPNAV